MFTQKKAEADTVWALQRDKKNIYIYNVFRTTILSSEEDNGVTGFSCMRDWLWRGTVLKVF